MSKNVGKIFEDNWKASVPKDVLYYRPPDAAQSFNRYKKTDDTLRFSLKSPCDCMLFDGEKLYCLELKTVNTSSISFEYDAEDKGVIHKYQFESLKKFGKYKNVISGFLLDFRRSGNTYFATIDETLTMTQKLHDYGKKSFSEKDLLAFCNPILIEKKLLKVNYRYDVAKFIKDTSI